MGRLHLTWWIATLGLCSAALAPLRAQTTWLGNNGTTTAQRMAWNRSGNWTGSNIPGDGFNESAAFGNSIITTPTIAASGNYELLSLVFNSGADAFTITNNGSLTLSGSGISTSATATETIANKGFLYFYSTAAAGGGSGTPVVINNNATAAGSLEQTVFAENSTVGNAVLKNTSGGNNDPINRIIFNNVAGSGGATLTNTASGNGFGSAVIIFNTAAGAGSSTITNTVSGSGLTSADVIFNNDATAGSAQITQTGNGAVEFSGSSAAGTATISSQGSSTFRNNATADHATITLTGGDYSSLYFEDSATAGSANIALNGDSAILFSGDSTAGSSTIQVNAGVGWVSFDGNSTGGSAALTLGAGTYANFSYTSAATLTVGSIAGSGSVIVGANRLLAGLDNTSTIFSGLFSDTGAGTPDPNAGLFAAGGSLTKVGTGSLTLSGSNNYSGGTVVEDGTLAIANDHALGSGGITMDGGVLLVIAGHSISNQVTLAGGDYRRVLADGASLASVINATSNFASGTPDTAATLLAGVTSGTTTLQSSFSGTSGALNDVVRLSDVYTLGGVSVVDPETGETDIFVLELSLTSTAPGSFLGWLNTETNTWVNAITGNSGNKSHFCRRAFQRHFCQFPSPLRKRPWRLRRRLGRLRERRHDHNMGRAQPQQRIRRRSRAPNLPPRRPRPHRSVRFSQTRRKPGLLIISPTLASGISLTASTGLPIDSPYYESRKTPP